MFGEWLKEFFPAASPEFTEKLRRAFTAGLSRGVRRAAKVCRDAKDRVSADESLRKKFGDGAVGVTIGALIAVEKKIIEGSE